jgi:O-antigen/teichoic acid export membrane protein
MLIRNLAFAACAVVLTQVVGSFRSFALARMIGPTDFGVWTALQSIVSLSPIVCLGVMEALLKRVPYFRGRADLDGLRRTEESVLGALALASVVLSCAFLLFPWLIPNNVLNSSLALAQVTAAGAAISLFSAFYSYRCAAYEDFKSVSLIDGLQSVLGCLCILVGALGWGLNGGVIGFLVGECMAWWSSGYLCTRAHGRVKARFRASLMADAVRVGFPITIVWWIYVIHTNVGRLTAISLLDSTATGLYGVASSVAVLFAIVPNTIGRVLYPRINAQIGAKSEVVDLRQTVVTPACSIALILPIAQIVMFYAIPFAYNDLLPKYKTGLICCQILIVGAFFVGLIRNGANYLIAADLQLSMMKYAVGSVMINAGISLCLVYCGLGINGIAIATSSGSALLATLIWKRVFRELNCARNQEISIASGFYLPFGNLVVAIIIVKYGLCRGFRDSHGLTILEMALTLFIYSALSMSLKSTRVQILQLCGHLRIYYGKYLARSGIGIGTTSAISE